MAPEEEPDSVELLSADPEPWAEWESRMVIWSFAIAITGIAILGWLINSYILP